MFASIIGASLISAFGFAWNANSQQAVINSQIATLQVQQQALQNMPERVARVEETVKSTDRTVERILTEQQNIGKKIDFLVQSKNGG